MLEYDSSGGLSRTLKARWRERRRCPALTGGLAGHFAQPRRGATGRVGGRMNDAEMWCICRTENVRLQSKNGFWCGATVASFPFPPRKCAGRPVLSDEVFSQVRVELEHCSTTVAVVDRHRARARLVEVGVGCEESGLLSTCARHAPPIMSAGTETRSPSACQFNVKTPAFDSLCELWPRFCLSARPKSGSLVMAHLEPGSTQAARPRNASRPNRHRHFPRQPVPR